MAAASANMREPLKSNDYENRFIFSNKQLDGLGVETEFNDEWVSFFW